MDNNLLSLSLKYEAKYLLKTSFIRKMPNGRWKVVSQKGKSLGIFPTKEQAVKRLHQIEFFKKKRASGDEEIIDLTRLKELSYSSIMRELRQQCKTETVQEFLTIFKKIFDALVINGEENSAEKTLPAAIMMFGKKHKVEINDD